MWRYAVGKDSDLYNTHLLSFEENNNKENIYNDFCAGDYQFSYN